MLRIIETYYLLFMIYAILGWCMEVIAKFFQYHRFINRGFLIGPYCPIYGWGALAITILLKKYVYDPIVLFVMGVVVCSILEYLTSYFMEKIYHARWWDYSQRKFNINGRICLGTMIPFGLLGLAISYVTNPLFLTGLDRLSNKAITIISICIFVIFIADNIISKNILSTVKTENKKLEKDNTEEITEKVRAVLRSRNWAYRRLLNAYPNAKYITKIIKENVKKVKNEIKENVDKAKEEVKENVEKAKLEVKENLDKTKENVKENIEKAKIGFKDNVDKAIYGTKENNESSKEKFDKNEKDDEL